ncbi:outer membrane protein assembly factor BamB family protein [Actinoplanes flavus]|uniref:PQQ-binding-like beta-propeller repeat protein n=1 Tax=Actinoplanes flavus TaxID=2820290 RepID=A0ABS3UDD0_9ACTN|nr:PQQ-binding-like beta-propeller repeat protein [Actinoplanes flavus]MBO3736216.1 PQQ-binding-like beta-propeller repeat protein [Actinoplanes flavus]
MPADLDDLFTALGRQADTLPLAGAERARERGRQRRTRNRAALAGLAVLLVLTGAGLAVTRDRHAEPILPATTPARVRGLAPVGEPPRLAEGRMWNNARISGNRVIGFSTIEGGGHETVAVDASTGATLWRLSSSDSYFRGVAATAEAVILLRELNVASGEIDAPQDRILYFHDPATGTERWKLAYTDDDRLVLHEETLVRLINTTGVTEAYDLASGRRLWSAPGGADRPVLMSGMATEADGREFGSGNDALFDPSTERAYPYSDNRLVQLTGKGRVVIRDIRTGKVRSRIQSRVSSAAAALASPRWEGVMEITAYEGTVYLTETIENGFQLGTPTQVFPPSQGTWSWTHFVPCERERVCVLEQQGEREARLVMIDAATGTVLRTTGAVPGSGVASMRDGRIMMSFGGNGGTALYDPNGQAMYSDNGFGGFLDDGNVLTLTQDAGDRKYTARGVSTIDYKKSKLGVLPEVSGRCDWDETVLTCPAGRELRIWRFTR